MVWTMDIPETMKQYLFTKNMLADFKAALHDFRERKQKFQSAKPKQKRKKKSKIKQEPGIQVRSGGAQKKTQMCTKGKTNADGIPSRSI